MCVFNWSWIFLRNWLVRSKNGRMGIGKFGNGHQSMREIFQLFFYFHWFWNNIQINNDRYGNVVALLKLYLVVTLDTCFEYQRTISMVATLQQLQPEIMFGSLKCGWTNTSIWFTLQTQVSNTIHLSVIFGKHLFFCSFRTEKCFIRRFIRTNQSTK